MSPRKSPQKQKESKTSSKRASPRIVQSRHKSCSVVLSRASVKTTKMAAANPKNQTLSTVIDVRARKSFPNSLTHNATQQLQLVQKTPLELLYEHQMNKSIEGLVSSMKTTFQENVAALIDAIEAQVQPNVFQSEVARMKANHANEIADLKKRHSHAMADIEAGYRARLEQAQREKDLAVEDAKKKQWCPGCGKGTKHKMMMFCNSRCQKKLLDSYKKQSCDNMMSESEQE
ncbi:uncharacterized protein LOC129570590 [Sitodiplosis mosellana]|uniref:uncharacterized protein LOC129570590 n=1 Tax=Sitodiplosis mosellana TaxID=263140 RepID=UPI00244497EE|nr:uncharacterized protein LOC129570590 [Sitodiplosis mosellana]